MTILLISLAPVFVIALYIYIRDKYEREPISLLLKTFGLGALITIPIIFVETFLSDIVKFSNHYAQTAYVSFIVASFVEEAFKFGALYLLIWRNKEFNEKFDGIVYAVFISLGFAAVENIIYVYNGNLSVGLLRALTAVPAHTLFGIVMGYYFGLAKYNPQRHNKLFILSLGIPIILHGIYDFIVLSQNGYIMFIFIPFIAYLWYIGFKRMKSHADASPFKEDYEKMMNS